MSWHVQTQSLLTQGELSEVLMVFRTDGIGYSKAQLVTTLTLKEIMGGSFDINEATMKAPLSGVGEHAPEIVDFLQAMTDAAWKIGIKPRESADSASELRAVRDHLQDMRKLAKVTE